MIGAIYANPYTGKSFFAFLWLFCQRMFQLFSGSLSSNELASDEIQVLVLAGVALSSALVGSFLVLRGTSMLANALSHTILLGIVAAFILSNLLVAEQQPYRIDLSMMLIASLLTGVLTTFLTNFLNKTLMLQEDASIGLVFTTLFALGIILVTLFTKNAHIGTEIVMGNVDSLYFEDLKLVGIIYFLNFILISCFFKQYQITTFDPGYAKSVGISTSLFSYLLMIQVSTTVIAAFRAVGPLMVVAFIVGPVLIARMLTQRLITLLFAASIIGVLTSIFGVALSRHLLSVEKIALSTGGLVVCLIVLFYFIVLLLAPNRGWLWKKMHRYYLKQGLK